MVRCLLMTMVGMALVASDWPQWRGPNRDGKSDATNLVRSWPQGGPPLLWRSEGMGKGYSSLSIVGDGIFTLGDRDGRQCVIAANTKDGSVRWTTAIGPIWEDRYGGSRGTPTYADGKLYALSSSGNLACLSADDGSVIWQRSLVDDFDGKMAAGQNVDWQFAESPLVDGDRVIVSPGGPKTAIVALQAESGREIWRCAEPTLGEKGADGAAYASIVISHGAGVKQYVQLTGRGVIGVEASSGEFLWRYNRIANDVANIATPLVSGDQVFASTGYGTGAALLQLEKSGDGVDANEVYFLDADRFQNHHGGMILHQGHIYTGTGHNKGFPLCIARADGDVKWGPIRNAGDGSAAVTFADGLLFMRYQNGLMVLVEATPEAYREKGSFMIPDVDNFSWSHPVVLDGRLYLREQNNLFCYDVGG